MTSNIELKKTWQLLGTHYRPRLYSAMKEVTLGDTVVVLHQYQQLGIVTSITIRGVTIVLDKETVFVKWCNVISYKKNEL